MDAGHLLQLLIAGLALGSIYALMALGFVVIYRASQVFNFAQGELVTLGTFTMVSLCDAGLPWGLALALAMSATGIAGAAIERTLLRPLVGRPVFVTIILTLFIGLLVRSLVLIAWGTTTRGMPTPWDPTSSLEIGGASILWTSVWTTVAGAVCLTAFYGLLRWTRLGVAMRATATDQEASLGVGIPVGQVFGASWLVAGMVATVAGVFFSMLPRQVEPTLGYVALRAFPAVVVGGLSSVAGTVIAAVALGVLDVLAQGYLNPALGGFGHNFHTVFPYLVMIAFLVVRPYGLLGRKDVERV